MRIEFNITIFGQCYNLLNNKTWCMQWLAGKLEKISFALAGIVCLLLFSTLLAGGQTSQL